MSTVLSQMSEEAVTVFLSPFRRRSRWRAYALQAATLLAALFFSIVAHGADLNAVVLAQVREMPEGGRYGASRAALERFQQAVQVQGGVLRVQPAGTAPNFCSEATYLVFLKTVEALRLRLSPAVLDALSIGDRQPDGHGVWGRWNANGPGTARLFFELGLGPNFDQFEQARPGDFMKIFWTREIGRRERGHSVIYLGREMRDGVELVRFWSSNLPAGYGEKTVPRSKIAYAVFSRLESPEVLSRLPELAPIDRYLAGLTASASSIHELRALTGM